MASAYMRAHADDFAPFAEGRPLEEFCVAHVETEGELADEPQIIALTSALGAGVHRARNAAAWRVHAPMVLTPLHREHTVAQVLRELLVANHMFTSWIRTEIFSLISIGNRCGARKRRGPGTQQPGGP